MQHTRTDRLMVWVSRNKFNLIALGLLVGQVALVAVGGTGSKIKIMDEDGKEWGTMSMRTNKIKWKAWVNKDLV
jgi:hypothetical protein